VLLAGTGLGLLVNSLGTRGLDLGRDHFPSRPPAAHQVFTESSPGAAGGSPPPAASTGADRLEPTSAGTEALQPVGGEALAPADDGEARAPATGSETPPASTTPADELDGAVVERLRSKGLQALGLAEAEAWWRDPLTTYEAYLFVDARDDAHYAEGHIPGAWAFDPFRPELHLQELLPLLPSSERIVVYCNGGACEDSENAALTLLAYGADPSHVWVFAGGITAWRAAGLPIERGARGSGELEASTAHDG